MNWQLCSYQIKDIVYSLHETSQPKPATFGNLDVELDIGFAHDYMSIVGQLILQKISPKFVVIGTGVYTNLYDLCASVLHQFGLCADKFIISDRLRKSVLSWFGFHMLACQLSLHLNPRLSRVMFHLHHLTDQC